MYKTIDTMKPIFIVAAACLLLLPGAKAQTVTNSGHVVLLSNERYDAVATKLMPNPIYPFATHSIAFSRDGKMLATGNGAGEIHLWNTEDGKLLGSFRAHTNWTFTVQFFHRADDLMSGGGDDILRTFAVQPQIKPLANWQGHTGDIHAAVLTSDDRHAYSAGDDRQIFSWDLTKPEAQRHWLAHDEPIPTLALSPDGKTLASGSRDDSIRLWNASTGSLKDTLIGHSDDVMSVRFSPDGKSLASAGYDQTVRLWDVTTGKAVRIFKGHTYRVFSLTFSPDGQWLASAGDSSVRLWNVAKGTQIRAINFNGEIRGQTGNIREQLSSVAFTPDGKLLAAGSTTGAVYLMTAETGAVVRTFHGEAK